MKDNIILTKTFNFSLRIIKYCELLHEQKKFVISNQLLKSGTSIGANIREAQNSESKNDFIHKFKIAAKEIEETNYWLLLCKHSENYPECDDLLEQLKDIENITNKIIITLKISGKK
ncbi:four helix bundle protein [Soonwooa buanensis]|uniref:Four helix bundle protein n=1 Tax=Soonwooa buanensis TaxID=619805 RepID=A0A1T5G2C4_9FLAO|nr:four helix bundle protein [Soonwooa buanensis]SKC02434.1 four helix bundle protein [Soonwooa buanensis]